MAFRAQNLTGTRGRMWRAGRCWLSLRESDGGRNPWAFHLEWCIPSRHVGLELSQDDEEGQLFVGIGLVAAWLSGERWRRDYQKGDRTLGFRIHHGCIWWSLWMSDSEWRSVDPRWRRGSFSPADSFFGKKRHERRVIAARDVLVPLPEGTYQATVTLFESSWRRPRWPRVQTMRRAEVEVPNPPVVPGKGENAWDVGDDAIYSLTCQARTVGEAVGHYVTAVLETRERYGGTDWKPREVVSS